MRINYRPEIDGLRAVAVLSVIFYHAKITIFGHLPFKGGFVGVDIFFVISGYLITSIILKEIAITGVFSFSQFYQRRIRRILPVLLLVMIITIPFAWVYLLPISLIDFSESILFSIFFSSNFYFNFSGQEYGAESGLLKPFLHTWSLSVEEQYYIIFPIILFLTFKYVQKYLLHVLILGFLISLVLAEWASRSYPYSSFYLIHTRIWELLAGSILSYFEFSLGHRNKNNILKKILPKIGFFLIIITVIFFKLYFRHPSLYTLIPVLGVCLIIWFADKDEIITRVLSTKIFVWIGLISYSLYLWHYPVLVFSNIIEFTQESFSKKILIGIIILTLSIFSYYFIEKPARNSKYNFRTISGIILISILTLVIYNLNIIYNDGYKNRVPEILLKNPTEKTWNLLKDSKGEFCFNNINKCRFNESSNKKIYMIGDSHMASITYDLRHKVTQNQYQFITSTVEGCIYFPGFNKIDVKTKNTHKYCNNEYFQNLKQTLLQDTNSIIIFGGRFPLYLSGYFFDNEEGGVEGKKWPKKYTKVGKYKNLQSSFKKEILELSNTNKIILVYPIPEVGLNPNVKIWNSRRGKFSRKFGNDYFTTSYKVYKERSKSTFELLDSIQSNNISRVYPHKLFCDTLIKNRCLTHDDNDIFYTDDDHPSSKGADLINNLIIKKIQTMNLKFKKNDLF